MGDDGKKERVRAALAGSAADRAPASLWGHDFLREWSPQELVAYTLEEYRAYDWDFIKLNPRATYFAEAWGAEFDRPTDQRQPRPRGTTVTRPEQLADMRPARPRDGVLAEHLLALRMVVEAVGDEVDVIHTIFSPLGVTGMLCGPPDSFKQLAEADADATHMALRAVAETLAGYARASVEEGASGIFFAPLVWASRDTCTDDFYQEFGRPYDLQVLNAVRYAPFNVLHVCREHNMIDLLLDYPVAAFNWADRGAGNPSLAEVKAGTDKAVMGGLDNARLHKMSPDEVTAQARDALVAVPDGLFLTAGCAINPETPAANRAAVAAAVRARE